jgi:hypothetical protein
MEEIVAPGDARGSTVRAGVGRGVPWEPRRPKITRLCTTMASTSTETKASVPAEVLALPYFVQSPTIDMCRRAIEGCPGFREVNKDDYVLFNYDFCFRGTFPDPYTATSVDEALLRQTRRYALKPA